MHHPSRRLGQGALVVTDLRRPPASTSPRRRAGRTTCADLVHETSGASGAVDRSPGRGRLDRELPAPQRRVVPGDDRVGRGEHALAGRVRLQPGEPAPRSARAPVDRRRRHVGVGRADGRLGARARADADRGRVLRAYSVESRDTETGSNMRGHPLPARDRPRPGTARDGRSSRRSRSSPVRRTAGAGGWTGTTTWPPSTQPGSRCSTPTCSPQEVGESITLRLAPRRHHLDAAAGRRLDRRDPARRRVRRPAASRISLLFHPPLREELVEQRVRFRARPAATAQSLPGSRAAAFVPYDNDSGLTVLAGAWRDWSDARERVGTALLLQATRERGWGYAAELDDALAGHERFVLEHVVADDGTITDDTYRCGTSGCTTSPGTQLPARPGAPRPRRPDRRPLLPRSAATTTSPSVSARCSAHSRRG